MTESSRRLNAIRSLLQTALDNDESYLYEGEMSNYTRSYASDAASELGDLFQASPPTDEEIECCIQAISDPERIAHGRSQRMLLRLGDRSRPILDALSRLSEPGLRVFALEMGSTSTAGSRYYAPLYGSVDMKRRLLGDPEEAVRIAALSGAKQIIQHNAEYLHRRLQSGDDSPIVGLFHQVLALLDDPAPRVRAAAAKALGSWASHAGREAVVAYLDREEDPEAREALAGAVAFCDPSGQDGTGFLNYPEDYPEEFKIRK